jgi:7-cyano-7-deazaguanine synthase
VSGTGGLCVLVSGGIDSAVVLAEAAQSGERVIPAYVRSGLIWEPAEMYWLGRFLETLPRQGLAPLAMLELPVSDLYGDHWSLTGQSPPDADSPDEAVYLPGRNILLLAKGGVLAARRGCRAIVMGPLASNPFPDGTRAFFDAMALALGIGMGRAGDLPVLTPLAELTKAEVVRRGADLRLDLTLSCLDPVEDRLHCGACNKCAERRLGFRAAGVEDPTTYATAGARG